DFVTRYGGEEFAIILPGANIEGAGILADKLRSNVEEFDFVNANKQPEGRITVSVGVASTRTVSSSAEELVHQSDVALYQAKERGRNQVILSVAPGVFERYNAANSPE
ncbi:MAG: GGDEF domain-containing protein, partial [bacterium]|nr:GGDEF domain-containing protein [bacterium]